MKYLFLFLLLPGILFASDRTILMVAIGDSTTAGTPFFRSALESPPDGSGNPEGAYAYWMMSQRPEWKVLNYGIAGETTSDIRNRLDAALAQHPRCAIVLGGVNDVYQGISMKTTAENLLGMYKTIKEKNILPVAATILPFDKATPEQAQAILALNTWIRKAADKMNIPIADLYKALEDPEHPGHLLDTPDGLHPGLGGYRKMGVTLVDTLDPIAKTWR